MGKQTPHKRVLYTFWETLINPALTLERAEERRQARLLASLLLVLIALSVYFALLPDLLVDPQAALRAPDFYVTLSTIAVFALAYVLSRTRYFRVGARLAVWVTTLAVFAITIPGAERTDANLQVYLVLPVLLSSIMLPVRETVLLIAAQAVGIAATPLLVDAISFKDIWPGFVLMTSLMALIARLHQAQVERDRQAELIETRERYRRLVELAPFMIAVHRENRIEYINPAGIGMIGAASLDDVLGMTVTQLMDSHPVESSRKKLMRLDGTVIDVEMQTIPFTDQGQSAVQVLARDITENQRAEEALRASEQRYRRLFERSLAAVYSTTLDGHILDCNEAFAQLLGYDTLDALRQVKAADLYFEPLERADFVSMLRAQGTLKNREQRLRRRDGTPIWLLEEVVLVSENGEEPFIQGTAIDITERKRTQQALWDSEARYRSLFEDSPLPLWEEDFSQVKQFVDNLRAAGVTDFRAHFETHPDQVVECARRVQITNVNRATLRMFEITDKSKFFKRLDQVLISENNWAMFREELIALTEGQFPFQHDNTQHSLRGDEFYLVVNVSIAPGYEDTWAKVFVSVVDITDRRRAEDGLRRRDAILQTLAYISERLLRLYDLEAVLPEVLARLGQSIGVSRAYLFENRITPDGTLLTSQQYEWAAPGFAPQIDNPALQTMDFIADGFGSWLQLATGHPIHGPVSTLEPAVQAFLEAQSIMSIAVVPIFVGGRWWGFLRFDDCWREREWLTAEVEALRSVAGALGAAIDRQHSEAAEREQRALSDALRDTASALNRTLDLNRVLDKVLTNIERVVPHVAANVMLFEDSDVFIARARGYETFGTHEWMETVHFPIHERPRLEKVIATGRGYVISDTRTDPTWDFHSETAWICSHICAPIRVEFETLGVINLDSDQPDTFTAAHAERLQAFADQAAIAIYNARLYDEMEQRIAARTIDLSVRNAVAETLSSSLDMNEMLNGVLQTTVQRLGVTGGAIHLLDADSAALELAAQWGIPETALDLITGIIPHQSNPGIVHTLLLDGVEPDIMGQTGISAVLSVPIWQQEQIQGVITLVHDQPRPWRNDETRMMDAIGRQIGIALTNTRLYAEAVRDEAHIRTILQSVADGLLVLDRAGTPVLMNPAAEDLFAFYPRERGGVPQAACYLSDWLRERDTDTVEFELPLEPLVESESLAVKEPCRSENCTWSQRDDPAWPCWLQPAFGKPGEVLQCALYERIPRRAIEAHSAAIRGPEGDTLGTVIALHDVTTYRELDRLKGRFVSTVSHELRTPLSAILLQVTTLLKYYSRFEDTERLEVLGEIEEQAYVLRELIEDILELSRFDARRALPNKQWFDLAAECREIVAAMRPVVEEKNLRVDLTRCPPSYELFADPLQLARAFRNLYSNAVKYTPPGGLITVSLTRQGDHVQLSVSDTGIGIAPEEQLFVFDRFYRTEEAMQAAPGTGLGLSITKEIADLHQGWLDLTSAVGQGSTFTLTLPAPGADV